MPTPLKDEVLRSEYAQPPIHFFLESASFYSPTLPVISKLLLVPVCLSISLLSSIS